MDPSDLWTIQHELLPSPAVGYRNGQVWIGGTHELSAHYAGLPAEIVTGTVP